MAQKKITVSFGAEFNKNDLIQISEDLRKAIVSGTSTDSMKSSAQKYAATIKAAADEIEKIKKKGTVDAKDVKDLKKYTSTIESNLAKLQETTGKISAAPSKLMSELPEKLEKVKTESMKKAKEIEQKMSGFLSGKGLKMIDFKNIDKEINVLTSKLKTMEDDFSLNLSQDSSFANSEQGIKQSKALTEEKEKLKLLMSTRDEYNQKLKESNLSYVRVAAGMKGAATKQQNVADQDFINRLKALGITVEDVVKEFGEFKDGVNQTAVELNNQTQKQEVMGDVLSKVGDKIKNTVSLLFLFRQAWRVLEKGVATIKELDKEMVNIGIVTKQTNEEMWKTFNQFNKLAMDLSTTTKQYLEGAKIFYQQGYKTAEVIAMVNATTKAAALSSVSFKEASETLTAAINAYNMEATEAAAITDKYAAVGAFSAADFHELSVAMEKVASSAYSAGMSFDSTLGILAKGIETTREAPEAIGTALKTIIARFQEMKENPTALLEDGIDANRVEKALDTVGVKLRDASGEFRDLDEVFDDLGEQWVDLSRNQKAYIATMAAGARQQSRFMAIMNDYDRTMELVDMSVNSAGEANAQYAIYTDSVEAAQNRLNNSMEAFYAKLTSSEALKTFYKVLSTGVDVATSLGPVLTGLTALITVLGVRYAFSTIQIHQNTLALALQKKEEMAKLSLIPRILTGMVKKIFFTKAETAAVITGTQAATAFNAATGGILLIAGAVLGGLALLANAHKSAGEAALKAAQDQQEASNHAKNQANNLDSLIQRYQTLNTKIDLSNSEREELNSIKEEIVAVAPHLIESIDKEGNIRLKNVETLREELAIRKQLAMYAARDAFEAAAKANRENKWEDQYTAEEQAQVDRAEAEFNDLYAGMASFVSANPFANRNNLGYEKAEISNVIDTISEEVRNGSKDLEQAKDELLEASNFEELETNLTQHMLINEDDNSSVKPDEAFDQMVDSLSLATGNYDKELAKEIKNRIQDDKSGSIDLGSYVNDYVAGLTDGENVNWESLIENTVTEYEQTIDAALNEMSLFATNKFNLEKEKSQRGFNDLILGMFETDKAKNPDVEYSELFGNSVMSLSDTIFDVLEDEARNGPEKLTAYEDIMQYIQDNAVDRADELYKSLSEGLKKAPPELVKAQESMLDAIENGLTQGDIKKARDNFEKKVEEAFPDDEELQKIILDGNTDKSLYDETIEKLTGVFGSGFSEDQIKGFYDDLSVGTSDFLVGMLDSQDDELVDAAKTMISHSVEGSREALNEAFSKLDPSSLMSIRVFKESLRDIYGDSLEDSAIEAMLSNTDAFLENFLARVTDTVKQITTLTDDVKKSLSGAFNLGDMERVVSEYGEGSFQFSGAGYSVSGEALVAKQRTLNNELIAAQLENVEKINIEMDNLVNKTSDLTQEDINRLNALEQSKKVTALIIQDIEKIDLMEAGIINNQSVMNGISSLNVLASTLQGLASTYEQVSAGGMNLFNTIDAIANNPGLIGALENQNGVMRLGISTMEAMAKQKKEETLNFLQSEITKVDAAIAGIETMLKANDIQDAELEESSKEAIVQMGSKADASIDAANLQITGEEGVSEAIQVSMDADAARTEQFLRNARTRFNALKKISSAEGKTITGDISLGGVVKKELDINNNKLKPEDYATILANRYGIGLDGGDIDDDVLGEIKDRLEHERSTLQNLFSEVEDMTVENMLNQIATRSKSGGQKSGSQKEEDRFEAKLQEIDRYINYLEKLEDLQFSLSEIDNKIGLDSTGGKEEISLIREKSKVLASQIAVTEQMITVREKELSLQRKEMSNNYAGWVSFKEGEMVDVRWDLINAFVPANEVQQEWIDGLVDSIEKYDEASSSIKDYRNQLIETKKAVEEIAKELIDGAIGTRQQLYDALVEIDQREIDSTKEKYAKMKESQDNYLKAIKDAIDKERQMRSDAQKQLDLDQKKRKLSVLERDTSGMYSQEVEQLRAEIEKEKESLRNEAIDRQYETLQKQYELQQEQHNIEISNMENQMAFRQETGWYWAMVDEVIKAGQTTMQNLLEQTNRFLALDPLEQQQTRQQIIDSTERLDELYKAGQSVNINDLNMVTAINNGAQSIANQIAGIKFPSFDLQPMVNAINNFQAKAVQNPTPIATPTPTPVSVAPAAGNYNSGLSKAEIFAASQVELEKINNGQSLQQYLNANRSKWGGQHLSVDGKIGPLTKAELEKMFAFINSKISSSRIPTVEKAEAFNTVQRARSKKTISYSLKKLLEKYVGSSPNVKNGFAYKKGGIVDYTGPAWVDGSKNDPEAFLSADQTKLFAHLRDELERKNKQSPSVFGDKSTTISVGDIKMIFQGSVDKNDAKDIAEEVRKTILDTLKGSTNPAIRRLR